ncbi:ATP-dependent RecD-like DNA helicase [Symmachiella dynata]|uniref:ATP-dependent RecD-like DNA helicase n=1 Tax=Symmachiella dynata TaxID=2527995 RepID=A0A517ZQ14_9PLAN|nr:DUF3320 domain-containing protein [Symmachiella dynata]QDU44533.1 ATP-dependent RecD-like DNA helicase [Symmachiella dynata]
MVDSKSILEKLESARRDLLDLTGRNRLISTPRSSTRSGRLEIVDELAEAVYRILVQENKMMSFLARPEDGGEETDSTNGELLLFQPDDEDEQDNSGVAERHVDRNLQTTFASEQLQRKLLKLYYDARTFKEEQGVNILYLAIGFLKWYEDDNSDRERYAPLLLIPVELDRKSANARFRLRYTDDDITTNLSLQEKLKADFGISLPDVPDVDELAPQNYFEQVRTAIERKERWQVLDNDMVLWFFSFAKFLMYRDLKPETWDGERQIEGHPLVSALLQDGFRQDPSFCPDDQNIDRFLQPLDMIHVMDADSSQTVAIEEVRQGRNLVIQGPPGTGKSQTITNLIATAVKEGKRVLFVAEKMAALEVVKRRLDNVGLGDMCLELHSHKANKKAVLEELSHTLNLGRPSMDDVVGQAEDLTAYRDKLNRHAEIMHSYLEPGHVTPFRALGELVRLRAMGMQPADFKLVDALTWSATDLREKQHMLEDLAVHMREVGNPRQHPWRGVRLQSVLPMDRSRIASTLPGLLERLDRLITATNDLADMLCFGDADTLGAISSLAKFADRLRKAPRMDRQAMANPAWIERRQTLVECQKAGQELAANRASLGPLVAEVAWTTDVGAARRDLAAHGRSWFRFFNSDYRRAQATLRGILSAELPPPLDERLEILDRLIQTQQATQMLSDSHHNQIGQEAFGMLWRGADSNWTEINEVLTWERECQEADIPDNFRYVLAQIEDLEAVKLLFKRIAKDLKPLFTEVQLLFKQLDLDLQQSFDTRDVKVVPLVDLRERIQSWHDDPEALTKWIAYFIRWRKLDENGMGPLAEKLGEGTISADNSLNRFQMAYFEDLMREAFQQHSELAEFDGVSHEKLLKKFRELDLQRIALARQEVANAHFQRMPTQGGDAGELGILRREMKKKRKHLPLRKLLLQAGHAVQAVKPVFMMSPISVAQYLEPGILDFDLLVIDEASQVRPVDAIGAVARARQVAVVGDDRQLPPTHFFSRVVGEENEPDDDGDFQASDLESILGLCLGQNMPQQMLKWHYRSRHHSLIAVSNREFYGDGLYVVPSPFNGKSNSGLSFRHIPDGIYDRGGSRTNAREAIAIAEAVIEHAQRTPDKTLGVGAFSVSQRDAILNELELRRRQTPELEAFFSTSQAEPFFVKNLENIQGDERDVILISVGYGKDASGYMSMSFGPLNSDGGERRLNVLITRARERCEIFSSITADDIDLNRTKARGVQAFKTFLTYAKSGFLDSAGVAGGVHDSEFERQVCQALVGLGFQVDAQIGVAGFFIDLGVVDPDQPGRYLLGIECDGASYHSSRSARDRDRLRQQVLEDRDWIIHRIWSTDWFHRPEDQLRKVVAAIEDARATWASRSGIYTQPTDRLALKPVNEAIVRHDEIIDDDVPPDAISVIPYVEAAFVVDTTYDIHQVDLGQLAKIASRVVSIEGPVHQDEVVRRVATLWGLKRAGKRIAAAVEEALAEAAYRSSIAQYGLFYSPAKQECVPIRDRTEVISANLRKTEYLPPTEIREALAAVVGVNLGMDSDEAATEVARLLGYKSTSSQLKQVISDEVSALIECELLEQRNGKLYVRTESMSVSTN